MIWSVFPLSFRDIRLNNWCLQAINQIESPELRRLLLYCCPRDVKDSDIPHRTKTRELILDAFGKNFAALRAELLVSTSDSRFDPSLIHSSDGSGSNIFHCRHLVQWKS